MGKRAKLLAVDDDPLNLSILEELLGDEYDFSTAGSGEEGLEVARRVHPDLVLLDIMMPGIDGYETCRRIKSDPDLRLCKVLLVSAKAMLSERLRGYEAGADDYITKPFDHQEIQAKVGVFERLKFVEEVDRLKTDLLSLLSHETRTPLNQIVAPAEILFEKGPIPESERREFAGMILAAGERLQVLLNTAMQMAELKAGRAEARIEPVDLVDLVDDVLQACRDAAEEKNLGIEYNSPESLTVEIDPGHIRRILTSVLDNAIEYSFEKGEVRIELQESEGFMELSATDRGKGVPPDALPLVFEAFAVDDINHHSGEIGLNLAFSRVIARFYGGEITLQSTPNEKTTVTVRLPLRQSQRDSETESAERSHRDAA